MEEINKLSDDELKKIINGCVDGVYPTSQELSMANELIVLRAKINDLINDIRSAETLVELKKQIGPSKDQDLASVKRLNEMESLYKKFGCFENMPALVKERYCNLEHMQDLYESEFC